MNTKGFWLRATIVSLVALLVCFAWGFSPVLNQPQGIYRGSYEDLIRRAFPHHLVSPESVPPGRMWALEETKARVGVVAFGWLVGLISIFIWAGRKKTS
jgi:hypothetical protein